MKAANESMKLFAQIETKQGCENIADIIQTEGVEGVFIGPNDLSADLNCIGDNRPILPYIEKIGTVAKQAGKVWGIITTDKELIAHSLRFGADMVSYGSEINMLKSGSKHIREMMLW